MNLCFVINHNYVEQLMVTLYSCYINNKDENIVAYVIQKDLTISDKNRLTNFFMQFNIKINFFDVNDDLFMNASHMKTDQQSYTTYYKIYILELLNKLDRVLYIDCDLIINNSLKEFYYKKFDKFLGVIKDREIMKSDRRYIKEIVGNRKDNYFNAGVILFNFYDGYENDIPKMEEIIDFLHNESKNLKTHDQDIFNHFFNKNLYFFDDNYNYFALYHHLYQLIFPIPNNVDPDIIHYVGFKPWYKGYVGFFKKKYLYYYNEVNKFEKLNFYEKTSITKKVKTYFIICRTKIHRFVNNLLRL